ncbi:T9SS type A sorting domain-containing protein [Aureispira anguillae]|uniref:T9SS type A sorting domain-containing protein n=1 Tax=Aureispira anguillae TaxID=2864201 RepID=A0A916DR91_9BACT|nr:T9SS type A sorting domain-containing protein [Aureispira anguillae]BDS11679.1 T9SS type A sorting domain-containing protein [Aureispira anguillae]
MKNLIFPSLLLLTLLFLTGLAQAQTVAIPDANFKTVLLNNTAINTNGDTEIQTIEAQSFSGNLNVNNRNILDLTGIEAFTALSGLDCGGNQLTNLNVTQNTALTSLSCHSNQLSSLNLAQNTALEHLNCFYNQLTSLNLTQCTALTQLQCNNNQLNSLDLSACTALLHLDCSSNQLTSFNITKNTALIRLDCSLNQISSLDLTACPALLNVSCSINQLSALDLSQNLLLVHLYCSRNQLSSLDLSQNSALKTLQCANNQLTFLNVKNGNNQAITSFMTFYNPNLTCIQVDNATYSSSNWPLIDLTSHFSTNCFTNRTSLTATEQNIKVYPNPIVQNFTVDLGQSQPTFTVQITNTTGQIILKKTYTNTQQIEIALQEHSGIYFLTIYNEKEIFTTKIIKE